MPKDTDDCEVMNELFDSNKDEPMPKYHWRPVALYNYDDTKIRDLTKAEQIEWIKKQKER
jgi:hypothetical protein